MGYGNRRRRRWWRCTPPYFRLDKLASLLTSWRAKQHRNGKWNGRQVARHLRCIVSPVVLLRLLRWEEEEPGQEAKTPPSARLFTCCAIFLLLFSFFLRAPPQKGFSLNPLEEEEEKRAIQLCWAESRASPRGVVVSYLSPTFHLGPSFLFTFRLASLNQDGVRCVPGQGHTAAERLASRAIILRLSRNPTAPMSSSCRHSFWHIRSVSSVVCVRVPGQRRKKKNGLLLPVSL